MLILTHNADKYGYLGHFGKNHTQPKTRPKGEIFSMMQVVSHRIWFTCILYPLSIRKMPFYALVFTLCSKVDLISTSAFRLVIAQSVQFCQKTEHRVMPIFFSLKGSTALIRIMKKKRGVTVLIFAAELQKVHTTCIFSDYWERTGTSFQMACMWKGEEGIK